MNARVSQNMSTATKKENRRVRNWIDSLVWVHGVARTKIKTQTASGFLLLLLLLFHLLFLFIPFILCMRVLCFFSLTTTNFACARDFNDFRSILFPSLIFFPSTASFVFNIVQIGSGFGLHSSSLVLQLLTAITIKHIAVAWTWTHIQSQQVK